MITYKYYPPTLDSMNRDDLTIWDHNPVISPFPVPNPSLPTAIITPPESNTATRCGEELRNRGAKPCIMLCRWCWCGDYAIIWVRSDWPCCARVNRCLTVPSVVNRGDFNRSIRSWDDWVIRWRRGGRDFNRSGKSNFLANSVKYIFESMLGWGDKSNKEKRMDTYHYNLEQFSSFLGCLIFAPG